jgi:hypothetical protein
MSKITQKSDENVNKDWFEEIKQDSSLINVYRPIGNGSASDSSQVKPLHYVSANSKNSLYISSDMKKILDEMENKQESDEIFSFNVYYISPALKKELEKQNK